MVETEVLSPKMCLLLLASVYYRILSLTIAYYRTLVGPFSKKTFFQGKQFLWIFWFAMADDRLAQSKIEGFRCVIGNMFI